MSKIIKLLLVVGLCVGFSVSNALALGDKTPSFQHQQLEQSTTNYYTAERVTETYYHGSDGFKVDYLFTYDDGAISDSWIHTYTFRYIYSGILQYFEEMTYAEELETMTNDFFMGTYDCTDIVFYYNPVTGEMSSLGNVVLGYDFPSNFFQTL